MKCLLNFSCFALKLLIWKLSLPVEALVPSPMSSMGFGETHHIVRRLHSSRMDSEDGYWAKYSGGSKEEMELRRMAYDPPEEDDFYGGQMERYRYDDDDYVDDFEAEYDDEFDSEAYDDDIPEPGSYWSNPSGTMDRPIPKRNRPPSRQFQDSNSARFRQRPPSRRSPVRTGQRPPPKPARDFYERLFWYGFDPAESEEVGDKTVFGGTKGKFNGLSYVAPDGANVGTYRRQLPPRRREYDQYYDDELGDEFDNYETSEERSNPSLGSIKPPNDFPYPRSEKNRARSRRRRRQSTRPSEYYDEVGYDDNYGAKDWIAKSVSSWFSGNDDDSLYDDTRSRRRKKRDKSEWSPFNIVDAFFRVDREALQYKADLYNEKMGLGKSKPSPTRRRQRASSIRDTPRRPGYAYRYNGDDEDDLGPILDIDPPVAERGESIAENDDDEDPTSSKHNGSAAPRPQKPEKSWEERSLAVERVPPADIPAWGPSGELPFDARTKAIVDALEDIQTAKQKLRKREKREALAREEITILRVDAELQRRKLENGRSDARLAQEQLRQIDFEIDDASRELRRARSQVGLARDELERLQDRHWALLGFYNPDQAKENVEAALREFEEVEPAAKLNDTAGNENPGQVKGGQDEISPSATKESVDIDSS
eukprot:scaffold4222_cov115-Cylindrotheca_fusiformis.AAC.14